MELVYLFREPSLSRIPFFDYDRRLFLFFASSGGTWNSLRREFVFPRNISAENLSVKLPGIPFALVEEKPNTGTVISYLTRPSPVPAEKFQDDWRIKLENELRSRKYSPRTIASYVYYNRLFCNSERKSPEEIGPEHLTRFLAALEKKKNYSASSINLAISAVRFFYKNICVKENMRNQSRPRQDKNLPVILGKTEIAGMLNAEKNPKHKLLLMLAYSSGLRVSELVSLRKENIDLTRKLIYIRLGKGRKDRCALLSEKAAKYIADYVSFNFIETWLFPGQPSNGHLTIRSAQSVFNKAVRRAGIPKDVSIHSLRHSFATHLLESGIDIRYIQTLLGHANLKTTARYTHVASRGVLRIKSPFDTMP